MSDSESDRDYVMSDDLDSDRDSVAEYDSAHEKEPVPDPQCGLGPHPLVEKLRSTLSDKPPFCSGTLKLSLRNFRLYYNRDGVARRIDLAGKSDAQVEALDLLEKACEPAPFGRNQESVFDESYRKAGKMDVDKFRLGLDVYHSRLVDIVRAGLLTGTKEKKDVSAELYKLNVYGKDAFFKPHKDTPRSDNMFGSLVIVFPTPHQGGSLVLRHEAQEWTFDAAHILSECAGDPDSSSLAYIAFFSDVEHEVLPVTSGHRVTVTYNLYWSNPAPIAFPQGLSALRPKHWNKRELQEVLTALMGDPTLLPRGGTLGFSLRHRYPVPSSWKDGMPNPLEQLRGWLKGSDAALFSACEALSLKPFLRLLFDDEEDEDEFPKKFITDQMVELDTVLETRQVDVLSDYRCAARIIDVRLDGTALDRHKRCFDGIRVFWVTQDERLNVVESQHAYYGGEASIGRLYMSASLLVDVGPAGDRANFAHVVGVHSTR